MKIGNPQNMEGRDLLIGISAVIGSSVTASDIVALKQGTNVVFTSASSAVGVLEVGVDTEAFTNLLNGKMDNPSGTGSSGQVLTTDGNGGSYWGNAGIASVTWSGIESKPAVVSGLGSLGYGNANQFLRTGADGSSVLWTSLDDSVTSTSLNAPTGSAVHVAVSAVQGNLTAHANSTAIHVPSTGSTGQYLQKTENGVAFTAIPSVTVETALANTNNAIAASVVSANFSAVSESLGSKITTPSIAGNGGKVLAVKSDATGYELRQIAWSEITGAPQFITLSAVSVLPTTDIQTNVIYLVPNGESTVSNVKNEYIRQNNQWELIGTTEVDLSNLEAHVESAVIHVPAMASSDAGKVLKVVSDANGVSAVWGEDLTVGGSAVLPTYDNTYGGKILQVKADGTGTEWVSKPSVATAVASNVADAVAASAVWSHVNVAIATVPQGDMTIASFVNGNGVVKSATTAGTALSVAGASVNGAVASATTAGALAEAITINGVALNGGDTKTLAQLDIASAIHSHVVGDIENFSATVSSIASNVAVAASVTIDPAITENGTNPVTGSAIYKELSSKLTPPSSTGNGGKVLALNTGATEYEWKSLAGYAEKSTTINDKNLSTNVTLYASDIDIANDSNVTIASKISDLESAINDKGTGNGDMLKSDFVTGTSSVKSAANATTVNGHTVSADVPADAKWTDTIPGSAVLTISVNNNAIGSFNANASVDSSINIPAATSTSYGVVKVETVVSNTTNAVANSVVSGISSTMNAHITSTALHVPSMTAVSNGQVLKVENGSAVWGTDLTAGGAQVLPTYGNNDSGKILQVKADGTGTEWVAKPVGDMTIASFVNGNGVVKTASKLESDITINGIGLNGGSSKTLADLSIASAVHSHTTANISQFDNSVSSIASTVAGNMVKNATITISQGNVSKGSFTLNQAGDATIVLDAGGANVTIDSTIASDGTNPVAGSAIYTGLATKAAIADLAEVAFTGDYNDLINKPEAGGGSVTVDSTITSNGTNPVAGSAIYSALGDISSILASL